MAITITPTPATNAYVQLLMKQQDSLGETMQKGNLLYNAGGQYVPYINAYEALSQARLLAPSVTTKHVTAGMLTTTGNAGEFPKVGDVLILVFTREHPVAEMAGTTLTNEFIIMAPEPLTYDVETLLPVPEGGGAMDFATAATVPEKLQALINWLEDSLVVTILKTRYPGNWTYSPSDSRLTGFPKQYDGA